MNRLFANAALGVGLAAIGWIASGYLGTSALALAMTLLIGAFYLVGTVELQRFRRATSGLQAALAALPEQLPALGDWIATLPAALRQPVRLRIEGERSALPGPGLTPYLIGLLVLLGMLGTFIGMVVTLNGAVMALESTTDLAAIRAALAAPVKGLGLAFGTSVAGVAASAMLGLASALLRRERLQAAQALDARIATTLRPFSLAHQRERTLETLQGQAQALPALVDQIGALVQAMQQRDEALTERLVAGQDRFHQHAQTSYAELAASVDRTLRQSLTDSARAAGETIRPVAEATLAGMASESAAIQRQLGTAVQQQLEGLATRFDSTVSTVADTWSRALEQHERSSDALAGRLQITLDGAGARFGQGADALLASIDARHEAAQAQARQHDADAARRSAELQERIADSASLQLEAVATRFGATAEAVSHQWTSILGEQQRAAESGAATLQRSLDAVVTRFGDTAEVVSRRWSDALAGQQRGAEATAATLQQSLDTAANHFGATAEAVSQQWTSVLGEQQRAAESGAATLQRSLDAVVTRFGDTAEVVSHRWSDALAGQQRGAEATAATLQQSLDAVVVRFGDAAAAAARQWSDAGAEQQRAAEAGAVTLQRSLDAMVQGLDHRSAGLLASVERAHAALQAGLAMADEQRLAAFTGSLQSLALSLEQRWQQAGERGIEQQRAICRTLEQSARDIHIQAQAHASGTIAEVSRLIETAAQAPRAAAEAIDLLRQKLAESVARDDEQLAERSRIMGTLDTLLGAVNRAATEQREAIDALVASAATMLERAGTQFAERLEDEAGRIAEAATQVAGSTVEVASVGASFGAAVQLFADSSQATLDQLQRIEAALDKHGARSDEQLAYYVAQAREIVELSVSSQSRIVEDLQQLAARPAAPVAEAA